MIERGRTKKDNPIKDTQKEETLKKNIARKLTEMKAGKGQELMREWNY